MFNLGIFVSHSKTGDNLRTVSEEKVTRKTQKKIIEKIQFFLKNFFEFLETTYS